jgi:hypothetical protein
MMNVPSLSENEIRKATKREDLIRETANQIIKDFSEFDLQIHFSGKVQDFHLELFGQMHQHVSYLLTDNATKFFNLLYRIDMEPGDIDEYQSQSPEIALSEMITELIIYRELKKVMTRDFFRNQRKEE